MQVKLAEYELVKYIKQLVLIYLKAPEEYYTMKTRKHEVIKVKQYASYFAKKHTNLSNKEIADTFGFKNHSSIILLVRKIDGYASWDKKIKKELKDLNESIRIKGSNIDLEKYYYINMNNYKSIQTNPERAIVFIGYDDEEINNLIPNYPEIVTHENTKKFILEQIQKL